MNDEVKSVNSNSNYNQDRHLLLLDKNASHSRVGMKNRNGKVIMQNFISFVYVVEDVLFYFNARNIVVVTSSSSQIPLTNNNVVALTNTEAASSSSAVTAASRTVIGSKPTLINPSPVQSTFLLEAASGPVDQAKNTLRLLVPIPPTSNSNV